MRLYDPQNIGQWVMQYLGKDNILSPFAGEVRSPSSGQETLAAPTPAVAPGSTGGDLSDLLSGLGGATSSSGGATNPSGVFWVDAWGNRHEGAPWSRF